MALRASICEVELAPTVSLSTTCLSTTRACGAQSVTGRPSAHSVVSKYRRSIHHQQYLDKHQPLRPRNYVTLNQCWFIVGPASQTVAQHQTSIDLQYCASPLARKQEIADQCWASIVFVYLPFSQADDICLWRSCFSPRITTVYHSRHPTSTCLTSRWHLARVTWLTDTTRWGCDSFWNIRINFIWRQHISMYYNLE